MEGVGARLGRSSTRYGPPTVFTGPVRKWKKKWVHVSPLNSNHHHHKAANGTGNGNGNNSTAHLSFYKWTPITPSQNKEGDTNSNNGNAGSKNSNNDENIEAEEPPKRKFKYIPIIVLEDQKNDSLEQVEDEAKPIDTDTVEATPKSDGYDEKPDINDVPMDENQVSESNPVEWQDLNESTLDLSLGLKARDGQNESDSKADQISEDPLE